MQEVLGAISLTAGQVGVLGVAAFGLPYTVDWIRWLLLKLEHKLGGDGSTINSVEFGRSLTTAVASFFGILCALNFGMVEPNITAIIANTGIIGFLADNIYKIWYEKSKQREVLANTASERLDVPIPAATQTVQSEDELLG